MRLLAVVLAIAIGGAGTLREGPLRFRYWAGGERLARHLAALTRGFTRLPGLPPDVLDGGAPVEIDLAPDPARWDSLTGGATPTWGVGIAVPEQGRIVLPAYGRAPPLELGEILRHEIAHVALHRFLPGALVPRWLDEGYATWASGGLDAGSVWMLRLAFLLHRAPPLDSLELEWPAGEAQARLAYLLSASAVALLAERVGEPGLAHLLAAWRERGSLDLALRSTFGITLGQFEVEWRQEVRRRYGWAVLVSDTLVFWLLVSPLLVVLVIVRKRRDRERLARLRASEPPDQPAWWVEPPQGSPADVTGPETPPPDSSSPASPP